MMSIPHKLNALSSTLVYMKCVSSLSCEMHSHIMQIWELDKFIEDELSNDGNYLQ